jgi:multisubunit Na+/H+ antiporter MnhE subunit
VSDQRRTYLRRVLPWLLLWSIFLLVWHVFVGHYAADELLFAVIGSGISVLAARVVFAEHLSPLRTEWRLVAQGLRMPKLIVTGTWEVLSVLGRQIFLGKRAESLLFTVPFDAGGDDDASAFRRALAIAYTTATPNFVVVGIDRERGQLVYHQIQESEVPEMTRKLGARA